MSDVIKRLNAALEGRYRIERELGEGGMATVYLAQDLRHERKVALKVLRPELAAVVGAERFLAEIKTTARLQHPHILPLHDSGEADSFLFYVMPYIEGESLRDRLDRDRQLPVDEANEIARKVAGALHYAHEQDIVHRDIKPANILMSRGEPLVADFGIALALSQAGGGRITETGLSLGTPHYMSPEQASGERSLDKRSDVYAVGAVLYEMLTGEPPYGGPTAQAVLARILTEQPRRVTEIRRTVPPHVEAAVAKALEKLPADRFESAEAFREALDDPTFRHVGSPEPLAMQEPRPRAGTRAASRRQLAAMTALLVLASLVAVLGWLRPTNAPPQPPVRVSLGEELTDPHFDQFTLAPDGSKLAIVTPQGIMLRTSDDPAFRLVPGTENGRHPAFSPDGEWIAFTRNDGALLKVSVAGGSPLTLTTLDAGVYMPSWGTNGEIVFSNPEDIYRVSDSGGEPEPLGVGGSVHPSLLPGGNGVIAGTPDGSLFFLPTDDDSARTIVQEGVHPVFVPEIGHIVYGHPDGGLFAVPFDPGSGEVTGPVRPVFDDVAVAGFTAAFTVSGNGMLVYRRNVGGAGRGGEQIVMIHRDGSADTLPLAPREINAPRFSPDGQFLAFESDDQIYTYDLELGTTTQLTFEGLNTVPVWSPDGAQMAYGSTTRDSLNGLMVKAVDGASPARQVLDREGFELPVDWPSNEVLVYERTRQSDVDLMMVDPNADSTAPIPFLEAEWAEFDLAVSPDGSLAAYVSRETGRSQVFVRRFPEPRGQWRISEGEGWRPQWSADGTTIFYWSSPQTADSLFAARVSTESAVVVESRENLLVGEFDFGDSHLDTVSQRIAVVQNVGLVDGTEDWSLWLVVNWFTELEDRLSRGRGQ